jgi:L-ascorbate metabolism protein UlaG (beta-lactamase superfamily)
VGTGTVTLIDTGYGDKGSQKFRSRMELADHHALLKSLQQVDVQADDLDWVILSHLHFDHAGGSTLRDQTGVLRPTFEVHTTCCGRSWGCNSTDNRAGELGLVTVMGATRMKPVRRPSADLRPQQE